MKMEMPRRKQNRLGEYDYTAEGAYFVTLCTQNRAEIFEMELPAVGNGERHDTQVVPYGAISEGKAIEKGNGTQAVPYGDIHKSMANQIVHKWVKETENKFPGMNVDRYVIMPDHLHLIVTIRERHAGGSLPDVMRYFKTMTTNAYIRRVKQGVFVPFDGKLWKKSYYDHVIRNQQDYHEVWEYIENNPAKWIMMHEKP